MIALVRAGTPDSVWPRLIAAVQEALRIGVSDAAAIFCRCQTLPIVSATPWPWRKSSSNLNDPCR
jgi:hypothetical protein